MKKLISLILVTVILLTSLFVAAVPASAEEVTDTPLTFKSGFDNLWFTDKQMTALPKTIEYNGSTGTVTLSQATALQVTASSFSEQNKYIFTPESPFEGGNSTWKDGTAPKLQGDGSLLFEKCDGLLLHLHNIDGFTADPNRVYTITFDVDILSYGDGTHISVSPSWNREFYFGYEAYYDQIVINHTNGKIRSGDTWVGDENLSLGKYSMVVEWIPSECKIVSMVKQGDAVIAQGSRQYQDYAMGSTWSSIWGWRCEGGSFKLSNVTVSDGVNHYTADFAKDYVTDVSMEKKATVPENHVPADFDGDGKTDEGAIAINSVAGLRGITGGKYYLTSDIVVTTGQDGVTAGKPVKGWTGDKAVYLDGCGYTVKMNENAGTADTSTSLFDGGTSTIYVKNLNVTGVINAPANHNQYVSTLGQGGGGVVVENVVSDVDITITSFADGSNLSVGGIWPKTDAKDATFKNVHFTGSITMKCPISTGSYGGVGGIVGNSKGTLTIENCSNSGNITVGVAGMTVPTGNANVGIGGLVGKLDGAGSKTTTIKRCENSGNLEAIEINNACVGGIVGLSNQMNLVIGACKNSGTIKGGNNVTTADTSNIHAGFGGILGSANNSGTTCKVEITGSSNAGKITTNATTVNNVYAGGIVGRFTAVANVSVVSCSNSGEIDISNGDRWSSAGGIIGTVMVICEDYAWSKISSSTITIDKCQNSGKISSGIWAAGIIASGIQLHEDDIVIKISYCINDATGVINAGLNSALEFEDRAVAGGIVGIMGCDKYDQYEQFGILDITYCYNKGNVTAGANALAAGGILGYMNGDSLIGNYGDGTGVDSKEPTQRAAYGITFDYYSQRTWLEQVANVATITCLNDTSGKVASIAGVIKNKFYLISTGAGGTCILGNSTSTSNYWIPDAGWTAQAQNDMGASFNPLESFIKLNITIGAIENEELVSTDWSSQSWNVFSTALTQAKAITCPTGSGMRQDEYALEIDAAKAALIDARNALVAEEVDYTELEDLINSANQLNESVYTPESWNILQMVLADAETAMNAKTQAEVDAAVSALRDAIDALDERISVDYSALNAAISNAESLTETDYSVADWNDILSAIDTAKTYLTSRVQDDIDSAAATLNAVVNGKTKLDRSELEFLINAADEFDENDYTEESWQTFASALADAIYVLENSRSQTEIDSAAQALEDAIYLLDEDISIVDYSSLTNAIAYAEELVKTDYSVSDWNDILAAIETAKTYLTSTSQDEVIAAAAALIDLINSKTPLDFSFINAVMEKVYELDELSYTVETWSALVQAFENAEAKLVCQDQAQIDGATIMLEAAINALKAPDYTDLKNAIIAAEELPNSGYTTESWNAYIKAIESAKEQLTSRSQRDINTARMSIVSAMAALKMPNYVALNEALDMAVALSEADYSEEDWANIEAAVETATAALDFKTQADIDMAATTLLSVISSTPKLDRDELVAIIAEANLKIEANFTVETWGIFIKVLANANAKITSRVQSDIDDAVAELVQAMNALASPDYTSLNESLEEALAKVESMYTEESWMVLSSAVEAAKEMLKSRSQVEIDEAKVTLDAAIAGLKDKGKELDNIVMTGGCTAAMSASVAVLTTVLVLGMGVKKKKED